MLLGILIFTHQGEGMFADITCHIYIIQVCLCVLVRYYPDVSPRAAQSRSASYTHAPSPLRPHSHKVTV
jgi:hypothetical protein